MKLTIKIREVCQAKGITTAYQLQKAANLAPATAARFYRNEFSVITIESLEKVCAALECDAGKLFVMEKPPRRSRRAAEPK
jgi:DNA-binding Xre family transcriptional regulator